MLVKELSRQETPDTVTGMRAGVSSYGGGALDCYRFWVHVPELTRALQHTQLVMVTLDELRMVDVVDYGF